MLEALDFSALRPLTIAGNHNVFSARERLSIFHAELERIAVHGRLLVLADGARVCAICGVNDTEWDSGHYGRPMARLYGSGGQDVTFESMRDVVRNVLSWARKERGITHFSAEVHVDDYALLNALAESGFRVLDMKCTGYADHLRPVVDVHRLCRNVREFRPGDRTAVMSLVEDADFHTRYSRDPTLRQSLVKSMYYQWFSRLLDGHGTTSDVLVFERFGAVSGCGAIGERDYAEQGVARKVRAGSLYVSNARGVGGYVPILYSLAARAIATHGSVETTISLNNQAAIRVLDALGPNRRSITTLAMHLAVDWLAPAA